MVLVLGWIGREFVIDDEPSADRDTELACTLMACTSRARIEIGRLQDAAHVVKFCFKSMCNEKTVRWIRRHNVNELSIQLPEPKAEKPESFPLRIEVLDRHGRRIDGDSLTASTTLWYPNGKLCDIVPCQRLDGVYHDGKLSLVD